MHELYLMVTILERKLSRRFAAFFEENGLAVSFSTLATGTASSDVLDYFGLDGSEKCVFLYLVTDEKWRALKRLLRRNMHIDLPGVGISFIVPVSSVGGKKTLYYLLAGQDFIKGDESALKETKYELLVVISNHGYTELVMDAARSVRAAGGTVLHAKGTGSQIAEKFLGVTLVPEKEITLIVTRTAQKNAMMRAIMEKAGSGTKAGSVVFSLPVTDTAGMRLTEDEEEEPET